MNDWTSQNLSASVLTHLPQCHIYAASVNQVSIGSDNGLSPIRRQAIIWASAGLLSIGPLGTNFSEILTKIHNFSLTKMHPKISENIQELDVFIHELALPTINGMSLSTRQDVPAGTRPCGEGMWQGMYRMLAVCQAIVVAFLGITFSCYRDTWKHFSRYWPFVRGIHRSPVTSPHKGQWRGVLTFYLICAWIKGWVKWFETPSRSLWCHCNVRFKGCSEFKVWSVVVQ